jgi:hypothetical protein
MSRNYASTGTWGAGLGPLTAAQMDANTNYFDTQITAILAISPGVGISSITQPTPTTILVTLTNSSSYTFNLPGIVISFKGTWAPITSYAYANIFTINNQVYIVNLAHISAGTFDAGANDGLGHDYYSLLLSTSGSVPAAGNVDNVLGKVDGTDFNMSWRPSGVPRGGVSGNALLKNSSSDFDDSWGSYAIGNLAGTLIVTPAAGNVLQYVSGAWANIAVASLGITFPAVGGTATPTQIQTAAAALSATTGTVSLDPTVTETFTVTPSGAMTINAASAPSGATVVLVITTSGTSSFTLTFGTNFKTTGTLATGTVSGKVFTISFTSDGTNLNETSRTVAM